MAFVSDPTLATAKIVDWLRREVKITGRRELVLGLSGGIDSALSAYLAVEAMGKESLHCILMPYKTSSAESIHHAKEVIDALGVKSRTVDISPMAEAFEKAVTDLNPTRRGNLCARLRMITLFDQAHGDGLVLGTSNKTEVLLGYGTLFGDAACSINPLGDLYKTDVRLLSKHLGVPESIQAKTPTADLWPGQTDEGELGHSYAEMDRLLVAMVDEKKSRKQLLSEGYETKFVERISSLIRASHFKRKPAPVAWQNPPYSTTHLEDPSW